MIIKTLLTNFGNVNTQIAVVLDIVLALSILFTGEIKLILFYLIILIIALISELFYKQITLLEEYELTAQNIQKLADQKLELHSGIRLAI